MSTNAASRRHVQCIRRWKTCSRRDHGIADPSRCQENASKRPCLTNAVRMRRAAVGGERSSKRAHFGPDGLLLTILSHLGQHRLGSAGIVA